MPWKIPLFESLQSSLRFLNPGRLARHDAHRESLDLKQQTDRLQTLEASDRKRLEKIFIN